MRTAPLELTSEKDNSKTIFGFWIYIMTDCILFASLFAAFAVLRNNTYGGPSSVNIFSLPFVLSETLILLSSSFTCGLAILAAHQKRKDLVVALFAVTFVLGLAFLTLELHEFRNLAQAGNSWRRSGFLSAFFTLVGTHGAHITVGLLWMALLVPKVAKRGLSETNIKRLTMLSLFWHFLDIVWIFIFTIVYMFGVVL